MTDETTGTNAGPDVVEAIFEAVKPHLKNGVAHVAVRANISEALAPLLDELLAATRPMVGISEADGSGYPELIVMLTEYDIPAERDGKALTLTERVEDFGTLVGSATRHEALQPLLLLLNEHGVAASRSEADGGTAYTLEERVGILIQRRVDEAKELITAQFVEASPMLTSGDCPEWPPANMAQIGDNHFRVTGLLASNGTGLALDDRLSGVRGVNSHDLVEGEEDYTLDIYTSHNFPIVKTLADVVLVISDVTRQGVLTEDDLSVVLGATEGVTVIEPVAEPNGGGDLSLGDLKGNGG